MGAHSRSGTVKHFICGEDELACGELRQVQVDGIAIVLVRDWAGRWHALRDSCPHQGAPLGQGHLEPLVEASDVGEYELVEDRPILRCRWHGYEFSVETGECPADHRLRVRTYRVTVEEGSVRIER